MSLGQKLLFFDSWQIFILMGNFFQIYGSSLSLLSFVQDRVVSTDYLENLFLGVGCFMAWVSIIHYIKQYGKLGIFVHLIQVGFPRILIESITFVPVAFAFITIGMTFFGWSVRFSSVKMSVVTLYTMLLGDSIQNVIYDLKNNGLSTFLAIIYVISFCWTFMLAVHNLWISIIVVITTRARTAPLTAAAHPSVFHFPPTHLNRAAPLLCSSILERQQRREGRTMSLVWAGDRTIRCFRIIRTNLLVCCL